MNTSAKLGIIGIVLGCVFLLVVILQNTGSNGMSDLERRNKAYETQVNECLDQAENGVHSVDECIPLIAQWERFLDREYDNMIN